MNGNTQQNPPKEHGFIVKDRAHVEIRGMTEVISFDEGNVMLATTSGNMTIEGNGLRVSVLDVKEGIVSVDGHIDSVYYTDIGNTEKPRGLFSRLLH